FTNTPSTTALQLQAYLGTISGLGGGNVSVSGPNGGPYVITAAPGIVLAQLAVVSGPAVITPTNYTVTPDPSGTPLALANRTFLISGFPTQTVSGTYSMPFGPDYQGNYIQDTNGNKVDINLNAGVDVLRGGSPISGSSLTPPYPSGNVNVSIPPAQTISSSID